MAVSIREIAGKAGVSHTTVSMALQDDPRISEKRRLQIRRLSKDMNYRPNLLAKGLVKGKTQTIGMITRGLWHELMRKKSEKLHELVCEKGYSFQQVTTKQGVENEIDVIHEMKSKGVDGLIICTQASKDSNRHLRMLDEEGYPYVLLDSGDDLSDVAGCYVTLDRIEASRIAVKHFVELGHKRIGYLLLMGSLGRDCQKARGYTMAMQEAGLQPQVFDELEFASHYEVGCRIVTSNAEAIRGMTALVCYNDRIAAGAIRGLMELGIKVPGEIAIIGFDNDDASMVTIPKLSTIATPVDQLVKATVDLLFERIKSDKQQMSRGILVKPELIIRESSGDDRRA